MFKNFQNLITRSIDRESLIKKGYKFILIPKNVTKESLISLLSFGLNLEVHSLNWDALEDGLTSNDLFYKKILIEHEGVPSLTEQDLNIYLDIINSCSSNNFELDSEQKIISVFNV